MTEVNIRDVEPITVAFLALRGAYEQIATGYDILYQWVQSEELTPYGPPMMMFLSDPISTPAQESMFELWAPISGPQFERAANEEGLGIRAVPGGQVAAAMHVGRYDGVEGTYRELLSWITSNGKQVIGPPMEVYLSDPSTVPEEEYQTEVRIPVG